MARIVRLTGAGAILREAEPIAVVYRLDLRCAVPDAGGSLPQPPFEALAVLETSSPERLDGLCGRGALRLRSSAGVEATLVGDLRRLAPGAYRMRVERPAALVVLVDPARRR